MAFEQFAMAAWLHELHANGHNLPARALAGDGQHPGETVFYQQRWFGFYRQRPAKLDGPLVRIKLVQNLFRRAQALVPCHMSDRRPEAIGRQGCERDRMKALRPGLGSEGKADARVFADFSDGTPKGKQFFGGEEYPGLLKEIRREPCPAEYRGNRNSHLSQPGGQHARNAKVLDRCITLTSSGKPCR